MDPEQIQTQDPSQTSTPAPTPPTQPTFDADAIAQAFVKAGVGQPPAPQKPAPTQAEMDAAMQVWKPTRAELKAMKAAMEAGDDVDEATVISPLANMRDGITKQAAAFTKAGLEAIVEHFNGQIQPMLQYVAEQNHKATSEKFFKTYPQLEDHPEIVKAVAAQLTTTGQRPTNQSEAFKLLAESTATVIKKLNPAFNLTPNQSPNTQATPRLATLSNGTGQGGAQGGTPVPAKGASDIWDPVK